MRRVLGLLIMAVGVAACSQNVPSAQAHSEATTTPVQQTASPSKNENVAVTPPRPADFEIRDFSIDRQSQTFGGAEYRGRGTLVTRDPHLAKGNFIVWVSARQQHKSGEPWRTLILLQDGLGTIQTFDYQTKDDEKKQTVRYYDWKILGYAPLMPGTLSVSPDSSAPSASAKN